MVLEVLSAHARRGLAALPERVQRRQPLAELALEKLRNCGIAELLMSADVGTPLARVQRRAHDLSLTRTLCGLASGPDDVWLLASACLLLVILQNAPSGPFEIFELPRIE